MKTQEFKNIIKEAVKEAIQEELKEILLEAVRAPKTAVVAESIENSRPAMTAEQKRAAYDNILGNMKNNGGNVSMTTADLNTFQVQPGLQTTGEGSALPQGNVGLDQIMGLMGK